MKKSFLAIAGAMLIISGCKTTEAVLLSGIPAEAISDKADIAATAAGAAAGGMSVEIPGVPGPVTLTPDMITAASAIRASGSNPVCGQFNMNSLAAISNPVSGSIPGAGILKIIAAGVVSGVAGGAVSELGIGSRFVESAVAGTVNQLAFRASRPILDKVLPSGQEPDTVNKIYETADRVNCPYPRWAENLSPKDASLLLAYLNAEFKAAQIVE